MAEVKITDLVDQSAIDQIQKLDKEIKTLLDTYTNTAKELAKGINIEVKVAGDIDKLEALRSGKTQEAIDTQKKLTEAVQQQAQVVANTSNTISRQLQEQEKLNKSQREAYTSYQQVDNVLSKVHASYDEQAKKLIDLNLRLKENKAEMNATEKAFSSGAITMEQYRNKQAALIAQEGKLKQEKRQLTQLMTAEDKASLSAASSYSNMSQKLEMLKKAYKEMSEAERQSAQGKELEQHIQDLDAHLKDLAADMGEHQRNVGNYAIASDQLGTKIKMLSVLGVNQKFASSLMGLSAGGDVFTKLGTGVQAFGKTLLGLLANPYVLAFLGIAGTVAAAKWFYDYNKGLIEASRLTENFTGLTGDAADKVTSNIQAIADHMGQDYRSTIEAANTLVQHFGVSWDDAMQLMQDGVAAGADMSGNFVQNIQQFAAAMSDCGVEASELIAILSNTRNGIFSEEGVQDIIKGGTRLRAMTNNIAKDLDAVGISSEQMQKDLSEGNITMLEAVQQVAAKIQELPENSQEAGSLMKDVFGRTAAEGGALLIQSLADVNTNLDECKAGMGELGSLTDQQMNAEKELSETMMAVFKVSGTSFEQMTIQAKTYLTKGLTAVIKGCVNLINWFINIYNKSLALRAGVQAIGNTFKTMWTVAKTILKQIYDAFSSLGTVIEGVFTLDPKKIKEGWKNGMSAIKDNAVNLAKEIGKNAVNAIDNTINGEMKEISLDLGDASEAGVGYGANRNRNGGGGGTTTSEDTGGGSGGGGGTSSAASKAAQDELRVLEQLEESKIALIQNSHEKEIATIRMNYKKKLDAITGESESEQQLRVNIAEQCEQAVGECELKYQQQIAQTNLANRLAIVEKGSQEELTLRLAQIEANRAKELAAAEKSGADLELINEKFNQQRQALEEEYAAKRAEAIESSYTRQSEITNNEHLAAVNALKNRYAEELKVTKDATATMAQYKKELAQLDEEYTRQTAQNTIEMLEEMLKEEQLSDADREKYESELAKAKISLESDMADAAIESAEESANADDDANKKRIENVMSWVQKAGEAFSKVTDLMTQLYDNEISRIEDEIDANTEAGEAEEERITDLVDKKVITEEEGEARKRAAEAETSKKEEELQKKKEALELKQAKWDKANSLAQAGIATALAITKALPNLVLAAIAASMGAVQIATIAATPLATYAKGTDFHEGGPAVVGDGGRAEVVMYRGNAWLTPDTPTIVDLPRGAAVIPSVEQLVMPMSSLQALPATATMVNAKSYNDTAMRKDVSEIATLIRRQTARQHADAYWLKYEMYKQRI